MRSLTGRIQRLDDFFESERWEKVTNKVFAVVFVLFLLMVLINIDCIVDVYNGVPSQ